MTCGFSNFDLPFILPEKANQAKHSQHYFKQTKVKLESGRKVVVTFLGMCFVSPLRSYHLDDVQRL